MNNKIYLTAKPICNIHTVAVVNTIFIIYPTPHLLLALTVENLPCICTFSHTNAKV